MNILSLKDVIYKVKDTEIIKGISIDVKRGDCISIVGPSGSGKSTLLKICGDLITSSSGEILFMDKPYSNYKPTDLRKRISYVIQAPELFGERVYNNFELPYKVRKKPVNRKRIFELLEVFNLDQSILEKENCLLSGGEKQRVALIRNLLNIPDVLLLDESTSSLDERNIKSVEAYIKELNYLGVTVLWITHDKNQSSRMFNKRITISEGKIEKMEVLING